jgi:RHS repeat-associated protein
MKHKFISIHILILLLSVVNLVAQESPALDDFNPAKQFLPPTPDAAAFADYVDVPVSLHTGTPNVNIPLYTLQGNGVSVPISVSYHASGIKVDQVSSWVGLGWSLNAGGMISRTVRGLPDEEDNGFMNTGNEIPDEIDIYNGATLNFLYEVADLKNHDSQPDIFTYSFNGYSGKFVFGNDGEIVQIPHTDLKIEPIGSFLYGPTFRITTPDGLVYTFGGSDAIDLSRTEQSWGDNLPGGMPEEYQATPSAWHLTSIQNPVTTGTVSFVYEPYEAKYEINYTERHTTPYFSGLEYESCGGDVSNFSSYNYRRSIMSKYDEAYHLKTITTDYDAAEFTSTGVRNDLEMYSGTHRLEMIDIKGDAGETLKSFLFSQEFWKASQANISGNEASKYRMYLNGIQEVPGDNETTQKPPYTFSYNNGDQLPSRFSFSQDHWGYFNNKANYQNFTPNLEYFDTFYELNLSGADRSADPNYSTYGLLERIDYPTGGYKEFVFEGNEIGVCQQMDIVEDVEVNAIALWNHPANDPPEAYSVTTPFTLDFPQQVVIDYHVIMVGCQGAYVKLFDTSNPTDAIFTIGEAIDVYQCPVIFNGGTVLNLAAGNYELIAYVENGPPSSGPEVNNPDYANGEEAEIYVTYQAITGNEQVVNQPFGGVRIKEIRTNDNNANEIVRKYEYTNPMANCAGQSSGIRVGRLPAYEYTEKVVEPCTGGIGGDIFPCENYREYTYKIAQSDSYKHITGASGDEVQYQTVWEIHGEHGENGKIYNNFSIVPDLQSRPVAWIPEDFSTSSIDALFDATYVDMSWKSGFLLEQRIYDKNDQEVQYKVNQYTTSSLHSENIRSMLAVKVYDFPCELYYQCDGSPEDEFYLEYSTETIYIDGVPYNVTLPDTIYYICHFAPPNAVIPTLTELSTYAIQFYDIPTEWIQLTSSIEMLDGVVKTTSYEYDPTGQHTNVVAESFDNSDGATFRTELEYAHEAGISDMIEKNIISVPIKVERKNSGQLVGGQRTEFLNCQPIKFYEILEDNSEVLRGEISGYTADGYPEDYKRMGFNIEDYHWVNGLLLSRTFNDWVWTYGYDGNSRLMNSMQDIDGQAITYDYDGYQRLKEIVARQGAVTTKFDYEYGSINKLTKTISFTDDTPTQTSVDEFDGLGRNTKMTYNGVLKSESYYDAYGRVAQKTYLPGNLSTVEYDDSPLNRPVKEIFPDGNAVEIQYGANTESLNGFNASTLYEVVNIDENGNSTKNYTDIAGRQVATVDALSGKTSYTYDLRSNVETITSPEGSVYEYEYDLRNRIDRKKIPGWEAFQNYGYDDATDLMEYTIDPNTVRWDYQYDDYGREEHILLNSEEVITNGYGETGIEVGKLKWTIAKLIGEVATGEIRTDHVYDEFGRISQTTETYPTATDVTTFDYNHADWLKTTGKTHSGNQSLSVNSVYEYDVFGREITQDFTAGNGILNIIKGYNNRDQMEFKRLGPVAFLDYGYYEDRGWLRNINDPFEIARYPLACPPTPWEDVDAKDYDFPSYVDTIPAEVFLERRFDVNWVVHDGDPPCVTSPCEPPGEPCLTATIEGVLDSINQLMQWEVTQSTEVPCEDGSTTTIYEVDWDRFAVPTNLYRVRLCDESERYILEGYLEHLPGDYNIVQTIVVNDAEQVFEITTDTETANYTLGELLGLIFNEQSITVGEYQPCGVPDCNYNEPCPPGEITAQQAVLDIIANNTNTVINYPDTLYEVTLCNGSLVYLLDSELTYLDGTSAEVTDTLFLDSPDDTVPITPQGEVIPNTEFGEDELFHMSFTYEPNGNIDTLNWQVFSRPIMQYNMNYDVLNRIKSAHYCEYFDDGTKVSTNDAYGVHGINYDADGNLIDLTRRGIVSYCDNGAPEIGIIDQLNYGYGAIPNRLVRVVDGGSNEKGFMNQIGAPVNSSYGYDAAGNLTSDPYKGLTIEYNALNLPEKVLKGGQTIAYLYDATGRKYRKTVNAETEEESYVQEYISNIEYRGDNIEAVYHDDGRILFDAGKVKQVQYCIKDHLGNVRLMVAESGTVQVDEYEPDFMASRGIVQESHYYPFGMNFEGPWAKPTMLNAEGDEELDQERLNDYQYNGKELDQDLGLNWHHYGARMYDATIGRFTGVDPISDKFPHVSTYNYAENSPIRFIDLHGLQKALPEDEYNSTVNALRNTLEGNAIAKSGSDANLLSKYQSAINHAFSSLGPFRSNGRGMSEHGLLRYLEGKGGHDVYDLKQLTTFRNFKNGYSKAFDQINILADKFNNSGATSMEEVIYVPVSQNAAHFSDFGTAIGSFGFKINVEMEKASNGDITGNAHFVFADTYRWQPGRNGLLTSLYGNHNKMALLKDIGAADFSIRTYFSATFTSQLNWIGRMKTSFQDVNTLQFSGFTSKHKKFSSRASYRLLSGGEKNNFSN